MNTVQDEFVWTHENAGQVKWEWADDDFLHAWLTGMVELNVWSTEFGTKWGWGVTIWTGHYPFVNDHELAAGLDALSKEDAKWLALRTACRWLVRWDADGWLEYLEEQEQERREAEYRTYLEETAEADLHFDAEDFGGGGRDEPHADLQRWD